LLQPGKDPEVPVLTANELQNPSNPAQYMGALAQSEPGACGTSHCAFKVRLKHPKRKNRSKKSFMISIFEVDMLWIK
jgi:hypothetical protein